MFNPHQFIEAYSCLEHGASRLNGIKYAIEQADLAQDYEWAIEFRHTYIQESVFHDDTLKAFIVFPEYISLCDQYPELITPHDLMWTYKWILEDAVNFYQISLEKINAYFDDYKKRCKEYGYGLSSYYMKRISCLEYIDTKELDICIKEFRKTERDEMSDCRACERQLEVSYELMHGSYDKAVKLAQPIFNGEEHCAEIPHLTYAMFMKYHMEHSNWSEASYYQKLLYKKIKDNLNFLREIGWIIEYFSITDLKKGLNIFKKHVNWAESSKNPMMNFYFWNGAYKLFSAIEKQSKETINIIMPETFEFYNNTNTYSSAELAKLYYEKAKNIADKFDERNGTSYFNDVLQKVYSYNSDVNNNLEDEIKDCSKLLSNINSKPSYISIIPQDISEYNSPNVITELLNNSEFFETLDVDFDNENQEIVATIKFSDEIYDVRIRLVKRPDLSSYSQRHSLDEQFIDIINTSEICILTVMDFNENYLMSYWLQLKVLETIVPQSAGILDYSTNDILSPIWLKIAVCSTVPPTPKYLFSLNPVAKKEEPNNLWIYTSGLERCGIREFDIISVNSEEYSLYMSILETFVLRAINDESSIIDEGEPIYLAEFENGKPLICTWIDWRKSVKLYPNDMMGGFNDHEKAHIHFGTIFMYPERQNYETNTPVPISSLSTEKDGDILIQISIEETERMGMMARERFSFFLEVLSNTENAKGLIKTRIKTTTDDDDESDEDDDTPQFEHIWSEFIECEEKALTLKLLQAPYYSNNFNIGDTITTSIDDLTDWCIQVDEQHLTPDDIYLLFEE